MGALSETYVDPNIAAASGAGTVGDPYGDIQHALDTMTRDGTNGDRLNIKAGTDEILAAALTLATYGTPAASAPLIIQGYTTAEGDGGIGGISGNASVGVYTASTSYLQWRDLHLHNTGSVDILTLGGFGQIILNVELDTTTGDGIQGNTPRGLISECHFHNIAGAGINHTGESGLRIVGNYFKNGTNDCTAAIILCRMDMASRNIISVDGVSDGIRAETYFGEISYNSIFSAAGTGQGIDLSAMSGVDGIAHSNLVEGFSGSGGVGFKSTSDLNFYAKNAAFNNATDYSVTGDVFHDLGDNEALSASPFAKSGSDTFANRKTYFAPVDTGNVFGGGYQ